MIKKEAIRKVKDFPSLVDFLANELEWPIDLDVFDDIDVFAYDFTPEELGLQEQYAAKINEIKQLRPLSTEQPWSVFWVDFEPRRLPITALRRILSKFVTKKRAQRGDKVTWEKEDLLFITAQGEGQHRGITFAHFHTEEDGKEALRDFSWDQTETHFHYIGGDYLESLRWPEPSITPDEWRSQWRRAFSGSTRQAIQTSKDLAQMMAFLAKDMRRRVEEVFEVEAEEGPLHNLFNAFKKVLIHDLSPVDFADTYSQTITYGLFSARSMDTDGHFELHEVVDRVPNTNPFLKGFLKECLGVAKNDAEGIDLDELGVVRLVELLDSLNQPDGTDVMRRILEEFGRQTRGEDPVIHFYEHFLMEYDAEKRMKRGVFYTPRPVVSFIVRFVDELLRTEFGLEDGLADTSTWGEMVKRSDDLEIPEGAAKDQAFVQILDPATGTGTFLVEVIDLIHKTMTEKWKQEGRIELEFPGLWNDYVPKHLLPRLHGYELMMAPYAIAHMKIGLKLYETGYRFESNERAQVYLTNALEPAQDFSETLAFAIPALAHEAKAVNGIKKDQRFTVVIGNPPYSGLSSNMIPWVDGLLKGQLPDGTNTASYYHVDGEPLGERKLWLQDDYVKFIRFSQWLIDNSGHGVHGYITNHGYLDNPTFRGMRWSLMRTYSKILVLDLHGNTKKKESSPDGTRDENVFEIQQGVGIGLFVKDGRKSERTAPSRVDHADLWGERERKYRLLMEPDVGQIDWEKVECVEPFYFFSPYDISEAGDYFNWPSIKDVLPVNVTGVVTARDHFVIDFDESALMERIAVLRDESVSDETIRQVYFSGKGSKKYPPGDSRGWKLPEARNKIRKDKEWKQRCASILYRPFDHRKIYYVPWMVDWPRTEAMPHMIAGENIGLITSRMTKGETFRHAQVTRGIVEVICMSPKTSNNGFLFPLYRYPGVGKESQQMFDAWPAGKDGRQPNFDPKYVQIFGLATELSFIPDGHGNLSTSFGPEDLLAYIYSVFHSPEYRRRYEPMLKRDFPRIPTPGTRPLFQALAHLGGELVVTHIMESSKLDNHNTTLVGTGSFQVEKVSYSEETVWVDKAKTRGFRGVPEDVWNFHIGGYQVCEKWLKDRQAKGGKNPRPGHMLTDKDIVHYQKIVVALGETIRIMTKIDEAIEEHGGWPDAFKAQ